MGMLAIGIGGLSTASMELLFSVRYKKCQYEENIKGFFAIKQNRQLLAYLLLQFLLLDFCYVAFGWGISV